MAVTATQLRLLEPKKPQTPFHRVMGRIRTVVITGFGRSADSRPSPTRFLETAPEGEEASRTTDAERL